MLYKVTKPRSDMIFQPTRFWHTPDWKSSSNRPREGYIEDAVLYAGDFDEVSIHLLPKVRRLRVRVTPDSADRIHALGYQLRSDCRTLLFARQEDQKMILDFCPTVFTFTRDGFEPIPSNEYITREPKKALACETITMAEAIRRWKIELKYVTDISAVIALLDKNNIQFSEQN